MESVAFFIPGLCTCLHVFFASSSVDLFLGYINCDFYLFLAGSTPRFYLSSRCSSFFILPRIDGISRPQLMLSLSVSLLLPAFIAVYRPFLFVISL